MLECAADHGGDEVAHPLVVTDDRVLVVAGGFAGLGGQERDPFGELLVVGDQRATTGPGDDLVAVERHHGSNAVAAGGSAVLGRPERLGRVGEDRDAVLGRHLGDRGVVGALAVEVDRDDCPDLVALGGGGGQCLVEQRRVHRPAVGLGVDEPWRRAAVHDGVGRGGERLRRGDHDLAAADTHRLQAEVERRRAAGQRGAVLPPGHRGELVLQRVDVGTQRGDPVRVERVEQQLTLAGTDVRCRQPDAFAHVASGHDHGWGAKRTSATPRNRCGIGSGTEPMLRRSQRPCDVDRQGLVPARRQASGSQDLARGRGRQQANSHDLSTGCDAHRRRLPCEPVGSPHGLGDAAVLEERRQARWEALEG